MNKTMLLFIERRKTQCEGLDTCIWSQTDPATLLRPRILVFNHECHPRPWCIDKMRHNILWKTRWTCNYLDVLLTFQRFVSALGTLSLNKWMFKLIKCSMYRCFTQGKSLQCFRAMTRQQSICLCALHYCNLFGFRSDFFSKFRFANWMEFCQLFHYWSLP